jgi:ribosomal protein L37E
MAKRPKEPQYRGRYHVVSLANLRAWNADPTTTCWRCGKTLTQVRERYPKAKWNNGHLWPNDPNAPLAAECSPCNTGDANRRRQAKHQSAEHLRW